MSYDFAYSVRDDDTGAAYSHKEQRTGNKTHGEYRVSLPDGRVQVVSYVADERGYRAKVSYEPASPPPEVDSALKYAPRAGKRRHSTPRRYRGRQPRPGIYKGPHAGPTTAPRDPDQSYLPETSVYIPAREDKAILSVPPPFFPPLSKKEGNLSLPSVSKAKDSYLPEPHSYLPTPNEALYLRNPSSPHFTMSHEKRFDITEPSLSDLQLPTKDSHLYQNSPSFPSKPESAYLPESTSPSQYLSPQKSSYYGPNVTDLPRFPGPPVVDLPMNKIPGNVRHPYHLSSYEKNSVTTYRPKYQRPTLFAPSSAPSSKNSSFPIFTTTTTTTNRPLNLPEVTSYKPSRPLPSPSPKPVNEKQNIATTPVTTHSPHTASLLRSPTASPLSLFYPPSYSPHPPTAPSYSVSIPVPYTAAPSYSEASPLSHSAPQPPYFGPKYGPHFPGPSYPPRITGLPSRLSNVGSPFST